MAVNIAELRKVSGLILESPYTSIANVGKIKFPFLPVNFILKDKFNSLSKQQYPIQYYFELIDNKYSYFCPGINKNLSNQPYYVYDNI